MAPSEYYLAYESVHVVFPIPRFGLPSFVQGKYQSSWNPKTSNIRLHQQEAIKTIPMTKGFFPSSFFNTKHQHYGQQGCQRINPSLNRSLSVEYVCTDEVVLSRGADDADECRFRISTGRPLPSDWIPDHIPVVCGSLLTTRTRYLVPGTPPVRLLINVVPGTTGSTMYSTRYRTTEKFSLCRVSSVVSNSVNKNSCSPT